MKFLNGNYVFHNSLFFCVCVYVRRTVQLKALFSSVSDILNWDMQETQNLNSSYHHVSTAVSLALNEC